MRTYPVVVDTIKECDYDDIDSKIAKYDVLFRFLSSERGSDEVEELPELMYINSSLKYVAIKNQPFFASLALVTAPWIIGMWKQQGGGIVCF